MIVKFSEDAEADLEDIGDFIAADNPSRAETFVGELLDCCRRLVENPAAYPLMVGRDSQNVRYRVYARYLIFYRFSEAHLEILRVLHGARDYEKIPFPSD